MADIGGVGSPATCSAGSPPHLLVLVTALSVAEERLPSSRAECEMASVGVLGVADSVCAINCGGLDALVTAAAVAGLTPCGAGKSGWIEPGHQVSFAILRITDADSSGVRALSTVWLQARL
jgi:hypothetical protein